MQSRRRTSEAGSQGGIFVKKRTLTEQELLKNQVKLLSGMLIQMREHDVKECFSIAGIKPSCQVEKNAPQTLGDKLYS